MVIKALSVKLPWAEMIMNGTKRIEFRTWYRKYRGPLLIVASKQPALSELAGKALCVVHVMHWRKTLAGDCSEWGFPTGWPRDFYYSMILSSRYMVNRIPIKGQLGIYNVDVADDSIIKAWNEAAGTYMNPPF